MRLDRVHFTYASQATPQKTTHNYLDFLEQNSYIGNIKFNS